MSTYRKANSKELGIIEGVFGPSAKEGIESILGDVIEIYPQKSMFRWSGKEHLGPLQTIGASGAKSGMFYLLSKDNNIYLASAYSLFPVIEAKKNLTLPRSSGEKKTPKMKKEYADGGEFWWNQNKEMWFRNQPGVVQYAEKGTAWKIMKQKLAESFGAKDMNLLYETEDSLVFEMEGNEENVKRHIQKLNEHHRMGPEFYAETTGVMDKPLLHVPKVMMRDLVINEKFPLLTPFADGGDLSADDAMFDPKELEMGIREEAEHKDLYDLLKSKLGDKMPITEYEMYKIISKGHLRKFRNYYTLLDEMESDAEENLLLDKESYYADGGEAGKKKFGYKIEMKSLLDDTFIDVLCTTALQRKHIIEMFAEIEEPAGSGKIKYQIKSHKIKKMADGGEAGWGHIEQQEKEFEMTMKYLNIPKSEWEKYRQDFMADGGEAAGERFEAKPESNEWGSYFIVFDNKKKARADSLDMSLYIGGFSTGFNTEEEAKKEAEAMNQAAKEFDLAWDWWRNKLSHNQQREYAKKHLQSFEISSLFSPHSSLDYDKKKVAKIWKEEVQVQKKDNGGDFPEEPKKDKRYTAMIDFYVYAPNDESAVSKILEVVKGMRDKEDNQAQVISLHETPFASMKSRMIEVPKY